MLCRKIISTDVQTERHLQNCWSFICAKRWEIRQHKGFCGNPTYSWTYVAILRSFRTQIHFAISNNFPVYISRDSGWPKIPIAYIALIIGVRGGGREGPQPPPRVWKISRQTLFSGQAQVAQQSWIIKNISIQWKIPGQLCFSGQGQIAQKSWIIKNKYSVQWIQGTLCFSGQAQVAQKSWIVKTIFNAVKYFRAILFFRASAVAQKSWIVKTIFNTVKNFREKLCFQGKRKLLKVLNAKSIFTTVKISRESLFFFQGKRKLLKKRELWKKFQYSVYSLGGDPCNLG